MINFKSKVIKGTLILTISSLASRLLGFLYRIFLSNLIGAKGMGIFQLIFPVIGFCVAISCGGIQIAVSRFVAEKKNKKDQFVVLISSIIMSLTMSLIMAIIVYTCSKSISVNIIHNIECISMLKLASFTIPLTALHSCIVGYFLGLRKTFIPAISTIVEQIVKVISLYIIGIVLIGNHIRITPNIAVYSMIISELFGVITCLFGIFVDKLYRFKIKELLSTIKATISVSYILTANKVMLTFLQCFEAILLPIVLAKSGMSSNSVLSLYGILTGMALPVITFPSAINTAMSTMVLPTVAKEKNSEHSSVGKTTELTIWFSCVSGIFCIGLFLCFGDFIGGQVFGQPQAGIYIKILSWLCPFMYLSMSMGSILHGLGKTTTAFVHNVIGIVIKLGFLWFLVPTVGINGYMWGLLLSNIVVTGLHCYYVHKAVRFSFNAVNCLIKPAIWVICGILAKLLIENILGFSNNTSKIFIFIKSGSGAASMCVIFLFALFKEYQYIKKGL